MIQLGKRGGNPKHIGKVTSNRLQRLAKVYGEGGLNRRSTRKEAISLIKESASDEHIADCIEAILIENNVRFIRPDRPKPKKRNIDLE